MQLIGIMASREHAKTIESMFWWQFACTLLPFKPWHTKARWLGAFDLIRDSDDVIVSDVRNERDAAFIEDLGGVVLRLRD